MIRSVRFFLYFSVIKCLRSKKSNYGLVSTSELGIIVARWIYSKKNYGLVSTTELGNIVALWIYSPPSSPPQWASFI
jgi:hypothetical protein